MLYPGRFILIESVGMKPSLFGHETVEILSWNGLNRHFLQIQRKHGSHFKIPAQKGETFFMRHSCAIWKIYRKKELNHGWYRSIEKSCSWYIIMIVSQLPPFFSFTRNLSCLLLLYVFILLILYHIKSLKKHKKNKFVNGLI